MPQDNNTREIIKQFRIGARRPVAIKIWERVGCWFPGETLDKASERFKIDRGSISRGRREGELTLETLVVILTGCRRGFEDLPDRTQLPSVYERFRAGYMEAMAYVRAAGAEADAPARTVGWHQREAPTCRAFESLWRAFRQWRAAVPFGFDWLDFAAAIRQDRLDAAAIVQQAQHQSRAAALPERFTAQVEIAASDPKGYLLANWQRWGEAFVTVYVSIFDLFADWGAPA
jgi:hypothetical protein